MKAFGRDQRTTDTGHKHREQNCSHCRTSIEVPAPDHLVSRLIERKVVVFAGAGISTESETVFSWTLYDEIRGELQLADNDRPSFPALMTRYCRQPDGRRLLLDRIRK